MSLRTKQVLLVAVILVCGCLTVRAGQKAYVSSCGWSCGAGSDCVPKRSTFGYTETRWRKWPHTEKPTPASTPEPLPAPEKEKPKVEAGSSEPSAGEEIPLMPTESEPESSKSPSDISSEAPPFEDSPPEPPKESMSEESAPEESAPAVDPLLEESPSVPKGSDRVPAEDDDPFKDDPIPRSEAPAATPTSNARRINPLRGASQVVGRPRGGEKLTVAAQSDPAPTGSPGAVEPRLLPTAAEAGEAQPSTVRVSSVRNPLRSEAAPRTSSQVTPAASWTAAPTAGDATDGWKRNPLRSK